MEWIMENMGNLIVGAGVIAALVLIGMKMIRDKRKGKSSCSCGCSNCPQSMNCGTKK